MFNRHTISLFHSLRLTPTTSFTPTYDRHSPCKESCNPVMRCYVKLVFNVSLVPSLSLSSPAFYFIPPPTHTPILQNVNYNLPEITQLIHVRVRIQPQNLVLLFFLNFRLCIISGIICRHLSTWGYFTYFTSWGTNTQLGAVHLVHCTVWGLQPHHSCSECLPCPGCAVSTSFVMHSGLGQVHLLRAATGSCT